MLSFFEGEMTLEQTRAGAAAGAASLVERHHAAMLRVASFRGAKRGDVDRAILDAARAATRAGPEERESVLFLTLLQRVAALEREAPQPQEWEAHREPAIEAKNLEPEGTRWAGWFKVDPRSLHGLESRRVTEARQVAADAVARLPLPQRVVVVLRDVAAWSSDDVARVLRLDTEIERRLLHTGRSRVRRALERLAATRAGARA